MNEIERPTDTGRRLDQDRRTTVRNLASGPTLAQDRRVIAIQPADAIDPERLNRSAFFARNTNTVPANGSFLSSLSTNAAGPAWPLQKSTGLVAITVLRGLPSRTDGTKQLEAVA